MNAKFTFEKETKNTVRFQEVVENDTAPIIGSLYIQKTALTELNYKDGQIIEVEIKAK